MRKKFSRFFFFNFSLKLKRVNNSKGFTLVELLMAMVIFFSLIALAVPNLANVQSSSSLNSKSDVLISDIRRQQYKAMIGNQLSSPVNTGIKFQETKYILFQGSWNPGDPANIEINLDSNVRFSNINFSNSEILFNRGTGEVGNYINGFDSVTLAESPSGKTKTIILNKYGVIE